MTEQTFAARIAVRLNDDDRAALAEITRAMRGNAYTTGAGLAASNLSNGLP